MWQKAVPFDSSRTWPLRACTRRTGLPFCEEEEDEEEEDEEEEEEGGQWHSHMHAHLAPVS
jgi:hypothetical protein